MKAVLDFDGRRLTGARPFAVFEAKDGHWQWLTAPDTTFSSGHGDGQAILRELRRALAWSLAHKDRQGAAMGYFAYDFARCLEPRAFQPAVPPDELLLPDVRLAFYEELEDAPLADLPPAELSDFHSGTVSPSDNSEYLTAIRRIRDYIAAGDIYQANYTRRFSAPLPCSGESLRERLAALHPAPFSAYLEWDEKAIVSNSPERFLKLNGRELTSQPIKGTAPRSADGERDRQLQEALQTSVKDRAENVMIVDLLRNDLGRVCEYGSVRVPRLFAIQSFPTLHHLVSTVTGTLRAGCDALDAFAAAFPCGSITGAPKFRAMQVIDELEPVRRGVAFGAMGYFSFSGDMEWNVAIRTMTCLDGKAYFHTGGGIVWDSVAEEEYEELQLKALALRSVLSNGITAEGGKNAANGL